MAVSDSVDLGSWFAEQIGACEPDLLRSMVKTMAEALMSVEADAICGAGYGERSEGRVNQRNGYREREWDTRAGTIELAIPKLRSGSYFPDWLLIVCDGSVRPYIEPAQVRIPRTRTGIATITFCNVLRRSLGDQRDNLANAKPRDTTPHWAGIVVVTRGVRLFGTPLS